MFYKKTSHHDPVTLDSSFYQRGNVVRIAMDLLGKGLFTRINGTLTGGVIVETEAYSWIERGCHAYMNKMTKRNAVMFQDGGIAYVYLCYGIHHLFNVVTNTGGKADAVLIRALEPTAGVEAMQHRMNASKPVRITSGPGKLTRALGIGREHNGTKLDSDGLWLSDLGVKIQKKGVQAGPRIGIDYAGADARLPWRFTVTGSQWLSK